MANTLGVYNPIFYANEALIHLRSSLGMASRIYMGFDEERRTFGKGDTINIRRPSTFTAENAPGTAADLNTETVAISLNNWRTVKFSVTDKELAYTGDRIVADHIAPAAYALADDIDQNLCGMWNKVATQYDATGSTSTIVADIVNTRKAMFDKKVPLADAGNMHFMVGSDVESILLQTSAFTQHQGAGASGVDSQLSGYINRRYGMGFFANQNVESQTYINFTDFLGTVTGAHAIGVTSVVLGALGAEAKIDAGRLLTIAGDTTEYVVTADATITTNAATVIIAPALKVAVSGTEVVTIQSLPDAETKVQNIAFHRNFAALAMAKLPDFDQYANSLGAQIASVQDPVTGLSVRARIYYVGASSKIEVALDTLYGYEVLDPHLACRMQTDG